jgi:hypothetical protein
MAQGPNFPTSFTSDGLMNSAMSAVDKLAGEETRKRLEQGVGTLAQSELLAYYGIPEMLMVAIDSAGTKLFHKFTK